MKNIKLFYAPAPNLGDLLSISIVEKVFGKKVTDTSRKKCNLICIGSILGEFLDYKPKNSINYFINKYFNSELKVWGSGFIKPREHANEYFKRKMKFYAIRGKVSLERCKKIFNDHNNKMFDKVILGDPGLLSSYLIDKVYKKKYKLGIVPHYVDQKNQVIENIRNRIKNSTIINVCKDPIETVQKISECELIISSAMHGLIVADSLNIPNMRIIMSDLIIGGDYKFNDYYSVYDIPLPRYIDLRREDFSINDLAAIDSEYRIKKNDVNRIRDGLYKVFPFK